MKQYLYDADDELFQCAVRFVVKTQHGGISTLQRNLDISFGEARDLITRMRTRGIVGFTTGSKASPVLVKCCQQCDRIGKHGFTLLEFPDHAYEMWFCTARAACRKRWPRQNDEEADR